MVLESGDYFNILMERSITSGLAVLHYASLLLLMYVYPFLFFRLTVFSFGLLSSPATAICALAFEVTL